LALLDGEFALHFVLITPIGPLLRGRLHVRKDAKEILIRRITIRIKVAASRAT
jgi:hypothetical protein